MKFPNHIILDLSGTASGQTQKHWIIRNIISNKNVFSHRYFTNFISKKLTEMCFSSLSEKGFIKVVSETGDNLNFKNSTKQKQTSFKKFNFKLKIKNKSLKNKKLLKKENFKLIFSDILSEESIFSKKKNILWDTFDVQFLRKEKIYTKLKYSRVPQYDIVSGGVAALFAGFLGFLICEKFGFELLDSGDFYVLFMYIVFLCFFAKLFLKLFSTDQQWSVFSFKWIFFFYKSIFLIFIGGFFL